ncbi:50S ribosomal protein L24 [Microscilla marina]|uniref:Large ribosomal subunit protein uL24 n=1 Tax=Microscilla marina ATCC 23134 TaxID=313606 RepID=A1ZGS6_MICM2|nr:50S ribosomal protein L24 [Microscilla marina]EAY30195.1 ribosomal protein L24 [Microscilla marina ATCC 23134]
MERKKNKQPKLHLKKGDKVRVIAGNSRGKEGDVLEVIIEKNRVVVEGVNMIKKHLKPSANNPQGSIQEIEGSIHISNLMVIDPASGEPRRSGKKRDENGKLQRYFKEHTSHKKA